MLLFHDQKCQSHTTSAARTNNWYRQLEVPGPAALWARVPGYEVRGWPQPLVSPAKGVPAGPRDLLLTASTWGPQAARSALGAPSASPPQWQQPAVLSHSLPPTLRCKWGGQRRGWFLASLANLGGLVQMGLKAAQNGHKDCSEDQVETLGEARTCLFSVPREGHPVSQETQTPRA